MYQRKRNSARNSTMNSWGTQTQSHPMTKSSTFRISMLALTRRYGYTQPLPWGYRALFLKEDWKYAVDGIPKGRSFPFRVTRYIEMLRSGVPTLRNIGMAVHLPLIPGLIPVDADRSAGWRVLKTASKRHLTLSPTVLGMFKWSPCSQFPDSSPVRVHDSACVGKNLATMELLLIISTVIRRYEFRLITPDQKVCPPPSETRPNTHQIPFQLETREGFLRKPLSCHVGMRRRS